MTLRAVTRIPARVRLAYQLLRDYEAEQEPMSADEALALIANYSAALDSGRWVRGQAPIGASAWKEAVERKAPLYRES